MPFSLYAFLSLSRLLNFIKMQKVVCDTSVGFSIGFVTKNVQRLFEQKVFLDKAFVAVMDVAAVSVANVGVAVVMPAVAATLNGAVVVAMASDDIVVAATIIRVARVGVFAVVVSAAADAVTTVLS